MRRRTAQRIRGPSGVWGTRHPEGGLQSHPEQLAARTIGLYLILAKKSRV